MLNVIQVHPALSPGFNSFQTLSDPAVINRPWLSSVAGVSGAAPLSANIGNGLRGASIRLIQGYGLTELRQPSWNL
jgi:hypothetical protein